MRGYILCIAITLILYAPFAGAVSAAPVESTFQQPNGSTFQARQFGDEYASWFETIEGHTIIKQGDTWYYAASASGARLSASLDAVGSLSVSELSLMPLHLRPPVDSAFRVSRQMRSLRPTGQKALTHTQYTVVILVEYSDVEFEYSDSSFQSLFFGATNSVKEYYLETTYNNFTIAPAADGQGVANDGIVHVTRPVAHPNLNKADSKAEAAAILGLADSYINFQNFDSNFDGVVTSDELTVMMVLAGYEGSYGGDYTPKVWGHFGYLAAPLTLDSVGIEPYAMFGERHRSNDGNEHQATIGIMCHEFGHLALGLPDLYDIDGSSGGIGDWGLMGSGSWNTVSGWSGDIPAHLTAWSKVALDITTPTDISSSTTGFPVLEGHSNASIVRLWIDPYRVREHFLIENRQQADYDAGLPGSGLMIQHIDGSRIDNSDESHKWVDIEEADGFDSLDSFAYGGDAGDLYPGTSDNRSFYRISGPSSRDHAGAETGVGITNIPNSGASMAIDITPDTDGGTGGHLRYDDVTAPFAGLGYGNSEVWTAVRYTNDTSMTQLDGFEIYCDNDATVDFHLYESMVSDVPTTQLHMQTGFAAVTGWNRFELDVPQLFPLSSDRIIVLKITEATDAAAAFDGRGSYDGRSWLSSSGVGSYLPLNAGSGLPFDLYQIALLSATPVPEVSSIVCADPTPTGAASADFLVTFSEDVSGVDTGDFALTVSGVSGASVSNVTGTGNTRTVTIATGTGDGVIWLDLVDNDTILDNANVPLGGIGIGNGDFSSVEFYRFYRSGPVLGLWPGTLNLGPSAGTGMFTVTNSGTGSLDWSASPGGFVTSVTPSSGTLTAGQSVNVTVGNAANTSTIFTYTALFNVTSASGQGSPGKVALRIARATSVQEPPDTPPASISYPATNQTGQFFVTWPSSCACTYTVERSTDGGATWSVLGFTTGTSYLQNFMPSGSYRYRVSAGGVGGGWVTGTFDCNVQRDPRLVVIGQPTSFGSRAGSSSATIGNTGAPVLNWTTASNSSWLTLSGGDRSLNYAQYTGLSFSVTENTSRLPRLGTAVLSSPGALGIPRKVYIYQQGVYFDLNVKYGAETGGTPVTLTGANIGTGLQSIYFGASEASIQSTGTNSVQVLTPPGTGMVDVVVVKASGSDTLSEYFEYQAEVSLPLNGLMVVGALVVVGVIAIRRRRS